MKNQNFERALEAVIALKMKAVEVFIEKYIEPIGDIGNPEKVIGKKYADWTPTDVALLRGVYGDSEVLNNFIFNKELKSIKALEAV